MKLREGWRTRRGLQKRAQKRILASKFAVKNDVGSLKVIFWREKWWDGYLKSSHATHVRLLLAEMSENSNEIQIEFVECTQFSHNDAHLLSVALFSSNGAMTTWIFYFTTCKLREVLASCERNRWAHWKFINWRNSWNSLPNGRLQFKHCKEKLLPHSIIQIDVFELSINPIRSKRVILQR